MSNNTDIIIVGAGMIGLSAAVALADKGFSLNVIDAKAPFFDTNAAFDCRTVAINPSHWQWLKTLGLELDPYAGLIQRMDITDANSSSQFDIEAPTGKDALAYVIENRELVNALWQHLKQHSHVSINCNFRVEQLSQDTHQATLHSQDQSISGKLVIAADGKHSRLRQLCQISCDHHDHRHNAVVTIVKSEHLHLDTARQTFHNKDIIGLLPLHQDKHFAVIYSTPPQKAAELMAMSDFDFNCTLSNAFDMTLGLLETVMPRYTIPLTMQHAHTYIDQHVVLVGDAAHSIHPLAGLGANLGLGDIRNLTEKLNHPSKLQKRQPLRAYERQQRHHNQDMLNLMRMLQESFDDTHTWAKQSRALGLGILQKCLPAKQILANLMSK